MGVVNRLIAFANFRSGSRQVGNNAQNIIQKRIPGKPIFTCSIEAIVQKIRKRLGKGLPFRVEYFHSRLRYHE